MKAAFPLVKGMRASSSPYEVTPRGEIVPTQLRNRLSTPAAFALLIDALPPSTKWPPPTEATHSRASQVRPSYELPWYTKPAKFGLDARSPAWIFFAIVPSWLQVFGGVL